MTILYHQFLFLIWLILCCGNLIFHKKKEIKMIKKQFFNEKQKQINAKKLSGNIKCHSLL